MAEQITFGKVTTGASDDLAKVTRIARGMVYEYGMGTSIRSHQVPADDWNISEMMRQRRDEEVSEIAEEAYRGAHRLLSDHRGLLDAIAEELLVDESIDRARIAEIMGAERRISDPDDDGAQEAPVGSPPVAEALRTRGDGGSPQAAPPEHAPGREPLT